MTTTQSDLSKSFPVDQVGIEERAKRFTTRSIKNECKKEGLLRVLNMIDLTTLEGADTPSKVKQLCYKAEHLHDSIPDLPTTAAVCVYPTFVDVARKALSDDTTVKNSFSRHSFSLWAEHYGAKVGRDTQGRRGWS